MNVIVADMDIDVVLGLDFMDEYNAIVDVGGKTMMMQGTTCRLSCHGKIGCFRVFLKDKVEVPARSEVIVKGQINEKGIHRMGLGLIEPATTCMDNCMVAKALVQAGETVPLRIANFSSEAQTWYPGTSIATITPIERVENTELRSSDSKNTLPEHMQDTYARASEGMNNNDKKQIAKLLCKYAHVFSETDNNLGRTGIIKHKIPTGDARPIKQPPRRVPGNMGAEVDEQIEDMLKNDIIQPSVSPWASGIVLVQKKDGTKRFCVDYRRLNDVTIKDAYPLPRVDESLDQLSGSKWFSCLDLSSGFWQVETEPEDRQKTAFATRTGLYEFNVMPFGLCNSPATFERLMETVLAGLHWQICLIYLDDIIVTGKTFEDMLRNLEIIFQRFEQANLKLKPRKCHLFKKEIEFLGHIISEQGVRTDPKKVECVENWPEPTTVKEVRSFLGLCSYYRRFIACFSEIAKPLHQLTEKDRKFAWTEQCSAAFQTLKKKLTEAPLLAHPDFSQPFILDTDASDLAIGSVLSQKIDGVERAVAFASRTLSKSERKYCVTRKELLAVVFFVKHFRHYLYGREFTLRTDHASLKWLMNFKNPEGQVARWLEILAAYMMKVEHRPGKLHTNADSLSRLPCKQCGQNEIVRPDDDSPNHRVLSLNQLRTPDNSDLEIKVLQESDDNLRQVRDWVLCGTRPDFKKIAAESYSLKSLWHQFQRFELHDGILVRRWDETDTGSTVFQTVLPTAERRCVLTYSHDDKTAGHLGIKKTLARVRQRFYWPGLQNDVRTYINGCEICARRKSPTMTKKAPMQLVRSGYPMERIAIDILGELPVTENGNRYAVVIADYFTKWTECYPMPNMEARTVAKILVEEVVVKFGIPAKIHSDQGRQFESKLFQEMCKILNIDKTRTTPYHPQSDGMVERFNKTLATMLSAYVQENQRNWDELIPYVMMAYRSSEHETTGMTPNMLMMGREVSTPLDLLYEMPVGMKTFPDNEWVWELKERLETAHKLGENHTGKP